MEESSISYRRSITDVVKEKDRGKSVHESQAKKSPSTNDASAKKEKKRKTEENATPSSPLNCRKRRSMSSRRYRNLLNEQIEKGDDSDYYPDSDVELEVVEKSMCLRCSKLRRKGNDSHHQFCSCGSKELTAFSGDPLALQMKIACSGETIQRDDSYDLCVKCKQFGSLMHCGGKDCMKSYHPSCLYPPLSDVPFGIWICFCCLRRKMEFGVYSVSQGIESILDSKDDMQDKRHYFVKFKGLAHFYNRWIPMSQMLIEDPVLLTKFNKKQQRGQENVWKHEWTEPHRLLQRRFLVPPEQIDVCSCGHGDNIEYCYVEWLVKWKGLGYEHATWEFENSIFLCSANGKALIDEFERRRAEAKELNLSHINKDLCVEENHLYKLLKLVDKFPAELNNELLISVSNIIKRWHKNQNAILIDDQEANIKSILSISRLVSYTCRPFLIISTVPSLSTWEAEFTRLVPSIDTVVYSGNKVVREMIRSLEFYEEGGCIMFNVLIASPDVIVEDLDYLNCLGWEGIVIDDCQKTCVSKHFEQFAILSSEFRLLILNSIPKETVADYYKLLSFLDLKGQSSPHSSKSDSSENGNELSILKKRLKRYIVYKGNGTSSIFSEYWVPIQLSALQLKQYCNILSSNSLSLKSRADFVDKLLDVLKSIRMCCDHPYLADHSLQGSLIGNLTHQECLDVGVNASSKFQLLDKVLLEMKKLSQKVLILIQTESSKYHLGHILDDILCDRFGDTSFAYIGKEIEKRKTESILKKFNDAKSETFVVVIEKLACRPRIKLSLVDAVIIFNSDWNPLNDLKSLKRITLCSQTQTVKIFRLYTPYTIEEKILSLAKEGVGIETDIENTRTKFRHSLLTWGVSCLFNKLNELDNSKAHPESLIDESLMKQMVHILATSTENKGKFIVRESSNIVKAHMKGDSYSRKISLCGDKDECASVHGDPVIFWSKLLETCSSPHTSGPSLRTRHANTPISENILDGEEQLLSISALDGLSEKENQDVSTNHILQLHTSSNENQMELEEGEIQEDATDHIFEVDKIFSERIRQIILKQGEETTVFKNERIQEKQIMVRYHDSVLQSAANNTEVIKKLSKEISEELEQFDHHVKVQRKNLVIMQIEARNKEKEIKNRWLEKASKGMTIEPYESLPLADTGFKYEIFNARELLEESNVEAPDVTSLHNTLNSNQPVFNITDADNPAKSLHGSEAALSPDAIIPKESVGTDRVHARTDNSSPQSAHARGAQGPVDNISDCQQESVNIDTVIEHTHCEEEPELDISQVEHTNNPESEHAHISPGSENAHISPFSEHAHVNPFSEHAHISPLSDHAHSSPGSEHALVNPGSEHARINCESVACSGLGRVPPVSNSVPETVRVNNPTTSTSQPEFSDFLQQLFAASHSFPRQEVKPDPIQNDLNMMRHWEFSISHSHQKKKLALAEECEKEVEQVRKKYTLMVQNEETVCNQRLMVMKKLRNTLKKSQILAELFRSNLVENNNHGNLEEIQGSLQSLRPETNQAQTFPLLYTPPSDPSLHSSSRMSTASASQMRNLMQKFPTANISGTPNFPSSSNSTPPQPLHSSLLRMGPPSLAVGSPSRLRSVCNSQTISLRNLTCQDEPSQLTPPLTQSPKPTISPRNLTSQGEPSQPTLSLVKSPNPTIFPRNITSQGGPSQPTQSLVQSPKPTISPRNVTSQGGPSQPTPPLIWSPKPTKSSRNLTSQGEWSQLTPPLVQPPKPTISPRKLTSQGEPSPSIPPLPQSAKQTISPSNLTYRGEPSQRTQPLIQSPKQEIVPVSTMVMPARTPNVSSIPLRSELRAPAPHLLRRFT